MKRKIIIGSRGSKLALIQSEIVKRELKLVNPDLDFSIQIIKTRGDQILDKSISEIGGKAAFTTELEDNLLRGTIDLAVHSLKDLPIILDEGLQYIGSPIREDARDVFISNKWKSIDDINRGGVIATGSVRRKAQLLAYRPDLKIIDLRGNVDTRINKLDNNKWDGIILAAAAMHRLNLHNRISEYLIDKIFVPAPGQGSLGIEVVKGKENLIGIIENIIDSKSTFCSILERVFLKKFGTVCSIPIGCIAKLDGENFMMTGYVSKVDGTDKNIKSIKCHKNIALEEVNKMAKKMLSSL